MARTKNLTRYNEVDGTWRCCRCERYLPETAFYKDRRPGRFVIGMCKACKADRYSRPGGEKYQESLAKSNHRLARKRRMRSKEQLRDAQEIIKMMKSMGFTEEEMAKVSELSKGSIVRIMQWEDKNNPPFIKATTMKKLNTGLSRAAGVIR